MILSQNWVGYIDRSYEQIKRSLLSRLGIQAPEINDHSESNPLIILLSMFAGVAEVLHLYIDSMAREAFLGTAQKYASVVKLVKLIDYSIKARSSATVDLLFTLRTSGDGLPGSISTDFLIPQGTLIYPLNSTLPFRVLRDTILPAGYSSVYVEASQYTPVVNEVLGITSSGGFPNQSFPVDSKYVHGSMSITIAGETWDLYNSFGLMGTTTKGAVISIDENGDAYLLFGDGINGKIPGNSLQVIVSYYQTEGAAGNLPPGTITEIQPGFLVYPTGYTMTVTNPGYSSGGTNFETIEDIRDRAPRSIRTLDRAVTYQDYIDIAMQVPGVSAAEVKYCCGKYVDVYITPAGSGIATTSLVNRVKRYMDCRAMITTIVSVQPAGITRVWLKAKVIGRPLFTSEDILKDVLDRLDTKFGISTIRINKRVSITDIIQEMESLAKVDTFEVQQVKIEPYARPIEGTTSILVIQYVALPLVSIKVRYKLIYKTATTKFELYKNGVFITNLDPGVVYNDMGIISFRPQAGVYSNNDKWEFTVFPSYPEIFPNTIIEIDDMSAPIIEVSPFINNDTPRTIFGEITIQEQGSSASCLPPCN